MFYADGIRQSCSLDIHTSGIHSLDVDIVAIDVILEFTFLTLVVIDFVEELGIEIRPFLKGKLLSEESWSHVLGNERSLDKQGAATTHRIDKVGISLPA